MSDLPQIVTRGFVFQPQAGDLLDGISERIVDLLTDPALDHRTDLEELLGQEIGAYLYAETKRRPVIIAGPAIEAFATCHKIDMVLQSVIQ